MRVPFNPKLKTQSIITLKNYGFNAHTLINQPKGAVGTVYLEAPLPDTAYIHLAHLIQKSMTFYLEFKVVALKEDRLLESNSTLQSKC